MKTTLDAVVLLAARSAACAQSRVTLYARAGTGMLGFKGAEDLGGGTAALFGLETALRIMNVTTDGRRLFSRRAYVGRKDETGGQLQASRNIFIDSDVVSA